MNADWIGKNISLDCGEMGFYQGIIKSIELDAQTITIMNAFKNGKASEMTSVTIRASDIIDLTFLEPKTATVQSSTARSTAHKSSTVQVAKKRPKPVVENFMSGSNGSRTQSARFSPAMEAAENRFGTRLMPRVGAVGSSMAATLGQRQSPRKGIAGNSYDRQTPNRRERDKLKDDDCFGGEIDEEDMGQEFDFEMNLALFDKKLVFEEIDSDQTQRNQPDVVRLVDCNLRRTRDDATPNNYQNHAEPKYRNDENVLLGAPAQYRPVETGEEPPPGEYVTDAGLIVPAISLELRQRLEKAAVRKGLGMDRTTELVARAGVELAVQLFGGAHRLNPGNSHQVPLAVIMCGPSRTGVLGMATARHLASQGVRTVVYLPDLPNHPTNLEKEFSLYKLTGQKWTTKVQDLPPNTVDLIICCLEDHEMWPQERCQPWFLSAQAWARTCRAPALSIDPPSGPDEPAIPSKISLVPGLPLWHGSDAKVYMANLAMPKMLYKEVGITYESPFGAKTVIPLHRVT